MALAHCLNVPISFLQEPSMADQQDFPTIQQVDKATKEDLARWYRFSIATTEEQRKTLFGVK